MRVTQYSQHCLVSICSVQPGKMRMALDCIVPRKYLARTWLARSLENAREWRPLSLHGLLTVQDCWIVLLLCFSCRSVKHLLLCPKTRLNSLHNFQCAVVYIHFRVRNGHRVRSSRQGDSRGIQCDCVLIGIRDGDGLRIVVEQDLERRYGHYGFHFGSGVRWLLTTAPVASRPDGIGNVATLKFDPHPGSLLRQKGHAHVLPRIRNTRHAPS